MTDEKPHDERDSDLTDLLSHQQPVMQMNLDHLTTSKVQVNHSPRQQHKKNNNFHHRPMSFLEFASSYTSMLCHYYPKACGCFLFSLIFLALFALASLVLNPTQEFGVLPPVSKYELTLSQIDHWCLMGGNDHCACEDPLEPLPRTDQLSWMEAVRKNQQLVQQATTTQQPDLVILGESVVEAMGGRWMGQTRSSDLARLQDQFSRNFPDVSALALGVAGDTAPNVLWRLMHGEMPANFNPQVWWISLGMNDLARMECSEQVVVLGILRVVEFILEARPEATIVVNSLLPMADIRSGVYPLLSDYSQAFRPTSRHREMRLFGGGNNKRPPAQFTPTTEQGQKAELAEQLREHQIRKKRLRHDNQKDTVLDNRKRIRKYNLLTKMENRLPLWTSIQAINQQLRTFCEKQREKGKLIYYFDSHDLFVQRTTRGRERMQHAYITSLGYPTPLGMNAWTQAIYKRTTELLKERADLRQDADAWEDMMGGSSSSLSDSYDLFGDNEDIDGYDEGALR